MTENEDVAASDAESSSGDRSGIPSGPGLEPSAHEDSAEPDATPSRRKRRSLRPTGRATKLELPLLIVLAVAIAVLLKTFVIQPFYIPSASMEKTLHGCQGCPGDRILVFKPVYHVRDPHPGDIVVFKAPVAWADGGGTVLSSNPIVHAAQWVGQLVGVVAPSERDLVKRVIATGGQTVKCCDAQGNVQVSDDGKTFRSLSEPYVFENDNLSFGPVLVPKGRMWVMGDHRGDSADSRYHCAADVESDAPQLRANCDAMSSTVSLDDVIGKSVAIAWPPSRWRTLGTPATFSALGLPNSVTAPAEPAVIVFAGVGLVGALRRRTRRRPAAGSRRSTRLQPGRRGPRRRLRPRR
jgi:signal peptidase I